MALPPILQLHQALAEVAPITGVAEISDGYRIDFEPGASAAQRQAAEEIAQDWRPAPEQDWKTFIDGLAAIAGFYAAVAKSPMAAFITARMVRLAAGEPFQGGADPLLGTWNAEAPALSPEHRQAAQQLAIACHVPLKFETAGRIEAA